MVGAFSGGERSGKVPWIGMAFGLGLLGNSFFGMW